MAISTTFYYRHCNADRGKVIAKTIGIILSHWTTLSGMYSPHNVAAAAMVGGCDAKKRGKWSFHFEAESLKACSSLGTQVLHMLESSIV